jgi:hypothetical protein
MWWWDLTRERAKANNKKIKKYFLLNKNKKKFFEKPQKNDLSSVKCGKFNGFIPH